MRGRQFQVVLLSVLWLLVSAEQSAFAFDPVGHDAIESVAYRQLLEMSAETLRTRCTNRYPDAQGCAALGDGANFFRELVNGGYLAQPEVKLGKVLPYLGSGAVDDQLAYQFAEAGQCAHFMADSADTKTPRKGMIPTGLSSAAYNRCIAHVYSLFDGTVRNPGTAVADNRGTYEIIHVVEDSFSAAHTGRGAGSELDGPPDAHPEPGIGPIMYLKPWALRTAVKEVFSADDANWALRESAASHAVKDARDGDWLNAELIVPDVAGLVGLGSGADVLCSAYKHPDAVPLQCLSAPGRRAKDAVIDMLIALGVAKPGHSAENKTIWAAFQNRYLAAAQNVKLEDAKAPGVFRPGMGFAVEYVLPYGVLTNGVSEANPGHVGISWTDFAYWSRLWPFIGAVQTRALYGKAGGKDSWIAQADVGGFIPLAGWFAVGTSPFGLSFDLLDGAATNPHYVRPYARLLDLRVFVLDGLMLRAGAFNLSWTEGVVRQPGYVEFGIGWAPKELSNGAPKPRKWDGSIATSDGNYQGIDVTPRKLRLELTVDHSVGDGQSKQLLGGSAAAVLGELGRWDRRAGYATGLRFTPTYHQFNSDRHAWVMRGEVFGRANFFEWISLEAGLGVAGRTDPRQGLWAGDWNFQHVMYVAPRITFGNFALALRLGANIETSGPQSGWSADSIMLRYGITL